MRRARSKLAFLLLGGLLAAGGVTPRPLLAASAKSFVGPGATGYVGSGKCRPCHTEVYTQWSRTPHATTLRNAKEDRSSVAAVDFARIPFTREDIVWSVGSHLEQKYVTFVDNDWYVLQRWWNLREDRWEWGSAFNWKEKPFVFWCIGCHATGFDPTTRTVQEPSVGCEACHGPGEKHAASREPKDIVDPGKLPKDRHDMICEQCHTDGKDTRAGGRFHFPAGFRPGEDISDYYTGFFPPRPAANRWYWGTLDYKERHRAFLFEQERFCAIFIPGGINWPRYRDITPDERCGTCHPKIFKASKDHSLHDPAKVECADCHVPTTTKDGRRFSIHDHRFDYSGPELECVECHDLADKKDKYYKDVSHKHTFRFYRVKTPGPLTIPQACARCHKDMDVEKTLAEWKRGY